MELTLKQLQSIMPRIKPARAQVMLPHLNAAMEEGKITTRLRAAAFLAQLGHESGDLRYMQEIWGPTPAQLRYEPPSTLAKKLGNTEPGDGFRYRGRGPIQLTGRANYRVAGKALGLDLEGDPDQASGPEVGFRVAVWYWTSRNLNTLADASKYDAITRAINGGTNGLEDRRRRYENALKVLAG